MGWFSRKSTQAVQPSTPAVAIATNGHHAKPEGTTGELEPAIFAIGSELLERARGHKAGIFSASFYNDALMNWSMKDPLFKVQMFRFVDCFPVLKNADDIYDHLTDYLSQPGVTVPSVIQAAITTGKLAKGLAVGQIEKQIKGMAGRFIAGTDAASALSNLKKSWDDGIAFSVDLLGEACVSDAEADAYRDKYLDLIENLPGLVTGWKGNPALETDHLGAIPRVNVSVKISSLSARCDPIDTQGAINDLMKRLRPILIAAEKKGVFINFDMEQASFKRLTIELFQRCCLEIPFHAGIAMQAYLVDGVRDAQEMVDWAKKHNRVVTVRLVKGAYWDFETINAEARGWPCPVWPTKPQTDACFEQMAQVFLDGAPRKAGEGGVKLALGSHNARSIAATIAYLDKLGLPRNLIELQMLHGMADQLKYAAGEMGLRIREYVPVGQMIPGMAYLVRRLLENTSNESWLKAGFLENANVQALLANPAEVSQKSHVAKGTTGDANTIRTAEPSASNLSKAPERHMLTPVETIDGQPLRPFYNEPFRDFSVASQHRAFAQAVAGAVVPSVAIDATPQQARQMVDRAVEAFEGWRDVSIESRSRVLLIAAEIMRERRDELSAVMIKESGKTWREADADTCEAIDFCDYYARLALPLFRRQRIGKFIGELDEILHEPRGVSVVIAPWNFPLAICCGMTVAALVTGNPVIIKPAEQTPGIAKLLLEILQQAIARVPEAASLKQSGIVQLCAGPGETTGASLVRDERIALLAFTGSRDVGLDILNAAAPASPFGAHRAAAQGLTHVKHVVCEMGGKNALILDTSADLDEAVLAIRHSAFGFQGQKCSACSRLIVVDPDGADGPSIRHVRERLVEAMGALTIGDPTLPGTDIGPVIDAEAKAKIEGYIQRGKASGLQHASLPLPANLPAGKAYVAPHMFWTVPADHELARDEIFGPVLAIMHAKDFDTALKLANSLPYKLTGGVFTRRPKHLELAKLRYRVGNLYINRGITGALVARHPFGGFGMSGTGSKAGGESYLHHFVVPRAIAENTMRRGFAPEL
jgi:RHH-type transcriptional regulator, proline utilization regulon repressor / proline dehydrogenase / delta 1-pyrroline-5-carboxylate dehydrogenase